MLVTQSDAKKIISAHYPEMSFKLSAKSANIGVRPVYDARPILVWIKLDTGKDSAVKIGQLLRDCTIDWSWSI